eukprot:m51a1_g6955 hypothetical protein (210) ;mRNA; f:55864-56493
MSTRTVEQCVEVASYRAQREGWPRSGRHIMAQYTDDAVLVYQSYNRDIAAWAVAHGRFLGAPGWSASRMSWVKTSFMWMMHRNGWGRKHNQEATLGVWLRREAFERILSHAREVGGVKSRNAEREVVRLQWDPVHTPEDGGKPLHGVRRDIQLGLKNVSTYASGEDIVRIVDLSAFVAEQRERAQGPALETPVERVYTVSPGLATILNM